MPARNQSAVPLERAAYTVTEAAAALRVSRNTIYKLNAEGQLRFVKLGKSTRIPASEVDALMADPSDADRVTASRRAQGLPDRVEDPGVLQRVAHLAREAVADVKAS